MSDYAPFNEKDNFTNLTYDNTLDYFFTQRKVQEYVEILTKNMERVKEKKTTNYNFLALNLPIGRDISSFKIEIWGDKGYRYIGKFEKEQGSIPHLLIRLEGDTQVFVKLDLGDKNSISFIQIPKRYQEVPDKKKKENSKDDSKDDSKDELDV
jgi:hypothetical protein